MKKIWLTGITILTMAVGLTACGETAKTTETPDSGSTNSTQEVSSNYDNSSLEGIREGIENDFSDTIQKINEKLEETNSAVGNSYEEYIKNKQLVTDWYTFAISEENALFERTVERSVEYYKLIATSIDTLTIPRRTANTMITGNTHTFPINFKTNIVIPPVYFAAAYCGKS